jgi:hypothetical protein
MFKGILPSKRIASSDFTMITNLGDLVANGKENVGAQAVPLAPKSARPALSTTKGSTQLYEKKRKADAKKGKVNREQTEEEGPSMNQAFDRLLVSQVRLSKYICLQSTNIS